MSELNPSVILQKGPDCAERVIAVYVTKLDAAMDLVDAMAKQSNVPQFLQDAKSYRQAGTTMQEYIKQYIGQEGDTMAENNSVWAAYSAAKKIEAAMGGAN